MEYKPLVDKLYEFYLGEIYGEELKEFFIEWANENKYLLPKKIRFLRDMSYNSIGEVVPIVLEDEDNVYYYDSCHRYCYLRKSDEGLDFKYLN
jgi:hypothetical protein